MSRWTGIETAVLVVVVMFCGLAALPPGFRGVVALFGIAGAVLWFCGSVVICALWLAVALALKAIRWRVGDR